MPPGTTNLPEDSSKASSSAVSAEAIFPSSPRRDAWNSPPRIRPRAILRAVLLELHLAVLDLAVESPRRTRRSSARRRGRGGSPLPIEETFMLRPTPDATPFRRRRTAAAHRPARECRHDHFVDADLATRSMKDGVGAPAGGAAGGARVRRRRGTGAGAAPSPAPEDLALQDRRYVRPKLHLANGRARDAAEDRHDRPPDAEAAELHCRDALGVLEIELLDRRPWAAAPGPRTTSLPFSTTNCIVVTLPSAASAVDRSSSACPGLRACTSGWPACCPACRSASTQVAVLDEPPSSRAEPATRRRESGGLRRRDSGGADAFCAAVRRVRGAQACDVARHGEERDAGF